MSQNQMRKHYQHTDQHSLNYYVRNKMAKLAGKTEYIKHSFLTTNQPVEGEESQCYIGKQGNRFLESLTLRIRLSSMSQATGSYIRLQNAAVFWLFQHIRFYDNGKEIIDLNPEQMYQKALLEMASNSKDYFIFKKQVGIDTDANRATAAGSSQWLYIDFGKIIDWLKTPFPIFKLNSKELNVRLKWTNDFTSLIQSDGTITKFTIEDASFIAEWVDPGKAVVEQINKVNMYPLYNLHPTTVYFTQASGSKLFDENLTQLANKNVVFLSFYAVTATNATTGKNFTSWETIDEHQLLSSGTELHNANFPITDEVFKKVLIQDYNPNHYETVYDNKLYFISYTNDISQELGHDHINEAGLSHIGSRYFVETDVQIRRNQTSNLGANERLYVTIWEYKPMMIAEGEMKVI